MYIKRDEAANILNEIADGGILRKELQDALEEIAGIIRHEDEDNLSLWGAEDDVTDLFVARREDLITPEWQQHCDDLYEKYKSR